MDHTLLLTSYDEGRVRTFSFDDRLQSILWVGGANSSAPLGALACVERSQAGLVVRPATSTATLVLPGSDRCVRSSVGIVRGAATMIGVQDERLRRRLRLYIRAAASGGLRFGLLRVSPAADITIGRDSSCGVTYGNRFVSGAHARITRTLEGLVVEDLRSTNGTVVNDRLIEPLQPCLLLPGDVVQILDFVAMAGRDVLCANAPDGLSTRSCADLCEVVAGEGDVASPGRPAQLSALVPFCPSPRLLQTARPAAISVDAPPVRPELRPQPAIVQMGPSLVMCLGSTFMAANAVRGVMRGGDVFDALPGITMALAMVLASVAWPVAARAYERRQHVATDARRSRRYVAYLDDVENLLLEEADRQREMRLRNTPPVQDLLGMARAGSPLLMSHTSAQDDFLSVRVGTGTRALEADVSWPRRSFSLMEDEMWDRVGRLAAAQPSLRGVPLCVSLTAHAIVGIVGGRALAWEVTRGLLVQVCADYSYQDVRVVMVASERERKEWDFVTSLCHVRDDDMRTRLVATSREGMRRIDRRLECLVAERASERSDKNGCVLPHYVVVCADSQLAETSTLVRVLSRTGGAPGFSLVFLGETMAALPRACAYLVDLSGLSWDEAGDDDCRASMFSREDAANTLVRFRPDVMVSREQARRFALDLARIRLAEAGDPTVQSGGRGFLALFSAGSVAHLNVGERWHAHDPSRSLSAPLGVDGRGTVIWLDLHEDGQGPHGLIAGTTGSGKSECLMTLILSLAVNYGPDGVSFLIIDYKGGGVAGAFERAGLRLPHLCGTITNLDGGAIRRSLVSLQAELRRRQRVLNAARSQTGEATMDIRRYLSLYRQGVLVDPLPHLVVVADEFAELRQQEPEFMEELMTAARIGRSLGVHLILATQKPTGVVNDQIWSNARFKLCLKVADVADSREMIRRDDAATLVHAGQFCLLVGYDEEFCRGRAAYAGGPYVERSVFEPEQDAFVELLDAEGEVSARQERKVTSCSGGVSELDAVVAHLTDVGDKLGMAARPLWIDPLPDDLTLADLLRRTPSARTGRLSCAIGLVDNPWDQVQTRLEASLTDVGNVLLYGTQGSRVEELLQASVASLAHGAGPGRLWLYGIDCGTGLLSRLEALPHWGGTVRLDDDERMDIFWHRIESELAHRRDLGARASAIPTPAIVVALANLAAWCDRWPDHEDRLEAIVREGPAFGIHVVASTASVLGTRVRLRSHFGCEVATLLHDDGEYASLLGSMSGVAVPRRALRGLVREGERVYEFQGVRLSEGDLVGMCMQAGAEAGAGPTPIPSLPPHVEARCLVSLASASRFPVGLAKHDVSATCADVGLGRPLLVVGDDAADVAAYLAAACRALAMSGVSVHVVDFFHELADVGDATVVRGEDELRARFEELAETDGQGAVLVVANVTRVFETVTTEVRALLEVCVTSGLGACGPAMVLASSSWQVTSTYDPWLRFVLAAGSGVWVGGGFASQSVFAYAGSSSAYRARAKPHDGFLVERGTVLPVRLLGDDKKEGDDGIG